MECTQSGGGTLLCFGKEFRVGLAHVGTVGQLPVGDFKLFVRRVAQCTIQEKRNLELRASGFVASLWVGVWGFQP